MTNLERPVFEGVVLVCDDIPMNLMVTCEHLKFVGLKVVVSYNGDDAIEKVRERSILTINDLKREQSGFKDDVDDRGIFKQFDLIFMDIYMPGIDGLQAAAKIHEIDSSIPIVAFTTDEKFKYPSSYMNSGIVDYLGKPFTVHELWYCLLKFLVPVNSYRIHSPYGI